VFDGKNGAEIAIPTTIFALLETVIVGLPDVNAVAVVVKSVPLVKT
jgi:hypothetical protein